jgi:uncharacterized protein
VSVERPIVVDGKDGVPLFAMLHEPDEPRSPRVGVSLLNPGLKNRVAPNRLNVRLARRLAREGYFVLRLDPPGIGDSGGDLPELPLPELWQRIQRGALVEPVIEAHREFQDACELSEVVGMGNCGGAITALMAGATDAACRRLVLIDLPVTVRGDDPDPHRAIHGKSHGAWVLAAYFRRLADWRAWLRFITFRSDMGTIGRALRARLFGKGPAREGARPGAGPPPEGGGEDERLNEAFLEALAAFEARSGAALFVTAEQDNNTILFDTMFASSYLARPERAERHRRITIKDANHIYGLPEWRDTLIDAVVDWMEATGAARTPAIARAGAVAKGETS